MLHSYLPAHLASTLLTGSLLQIFFDFMPSVQEPEARKTSTEKAQVMDINPKEPTSTSKNDSAHAEHRNEALQSLLGSSYAAWAACSVILCLVFAFWLFWVPLTYGQPSLTPEQVQWRQKIPGVRRLWFTDHEVVPVW